MDRFWETEVSEMKKNAKVVIGCSIVAAVCLTVAQLALAVMNYSISKKIDDSGSVSEDTE